MDEDGILKPAMVPDGTPLAPKVVLDLTRCSCTGEHHNVTLKSINCFLGSNCRTNRCSCSRSSLPCSEFCKCQERGCENRFNRNKPKFTESEEDSDTDLIS